jgi:hypothetical protein
MIAPQYKEVLDMLYQTPQGKALREYLEEERKKIDTVKDVTSLEEVLGRKHALELIDKIFGFLKEKKIDSPSRNQYN